MTTVTNDLLPDLGLRAGHIVRINRNRQSYRIRVDFAFRETVGCYAGEVFLYGRRVDVNGNVIQQYGDGVLLSSMDNNDDAWSLVPAEFGGPARCGTCDGRVDTSGAALYDHPSQCGGEVCSECFGMLYCDGAC